LAKLAGAMKGTLAKAARTFDALRLQKEAGAPAAPASEPVAEATPVAEAVAEPVAQTEVAEVPAVSEPVADAVVAEVPAEPTAE